jgi:hypothetical protein
VDSISQRHFSPERPAPPPSSILLPPPLLLCKTPHFLLLPRLFLLFLDPGFLFYPNGLVLPIPNHVVPMQRRVKRGLDTFGPYCVDGKEGEREVDGG